MPVLVLARLERLLHHRSDQSNVRASRLAQHVQPLAVGVRCHLALGDVGPLLDALLPPAHDDGVCHPRAQIPRAQKSLQREHRQQNMAPHVGVACQVVSHLHAHAAPCLLQVGFDYMVKA
jgi:hypothetical protein